MIDSLQIQPLRSLGEMQIAVELQQIYWGHQPESVIPAHMLFSLAANGGHVLAATDGDVYAGVVIGFLGTSMALSDRPAADNLHVYSKRMVVRPEYRNVGLGYDLKMAQRAFALQQSIRLAAWTFDPLLSRNAHLNIRKLGAMTRSLRENYYGTDNTGGLSPLGYSDRLYVEWWLDRKHVEERAQGTHENLSLNDYLEAGAVLVDPSIPGDDGFPLPAERSKDPSGYAFALVEIPTDYPALMQASTDLAVRWREHNRETLGWLLVRGYVATDFLYTTYEKRKRAFYVLSATASS